MKVTIYTLASHLGMTPSMVSRALSPKGRVSEEKRKAVLEAAEKLGYKRNAMASRLSMKSVKIGAVIYSRFEPVSRELLRGIEKAHEEMRDYKINLETKFLRASETTAEMCRDALFSLSDCDGVILAGFSPERFSGMIEEFKALCPNIVYLQNINPECEGLFASKHDESLASNLACEFLYNCLKRGRKNVVLFTGNLESELHKKAKSAFEAACRDFGLELADSFDMKDSAEVLEGLLPSVFEKHSGNVDGIYITSGNSLPLCEYVRKNLPDVSLVTFDLYDGIREYIEDGTVSATIVQGLESQGRGAFSGLAKYLVLGEEPHGTVLSDIGLIMKSNMRKI